MKFLSGKRERDCTYDMKEVRPSLVGKCQSPVVPIALRAIESRGKKVESRQKTNSASAVHLPPLLGPLSTFYSLWSPSVEMPFAFEKLLVYQKSIDFADAICVATEQFTRGYGFLVDQLNRASLSIAANTSQISI